MLSDRMIRAARLEPRLYDEVEHDLNATPQALTVVVLASLASGISSALISLLRASPGQAIGSLIGGVVLAIIGWLAWSFITYLIGTMALGGKATYGEMLRTIGFAQAPGVLRIFGFIPVLGGLINLVVAIWLLIAGIIAIRQALDVGTGAAILTALLGWLAYVLISWVLGIFAGIGGAFM
jgi:hypothetical protein